MALTLKATDAYIASARLDFLYSKSPVKEWKGLPYFGKASSDSSGGYSGYGKVAYSFRQPKKGGHWTTAAKIIAAIGSNPGSSPAELRNIVGIKDGFCVSLFGSLRLWMLVKSIKGKYYLTNTGVQYASKMLYSSYRNVQYYDFVTEQLVDRKVVGTDNAGNVLAEAEAIKFSEQVAKTSAKNKAAVDILSQTVNQEFSEFGKRRIIDARYQDYLIKMLTEINENYKKCIAENEAKINEIRAARADKLYDTVRIEIPAGLTNEEVKDILDKAYIRYITA